MTHKATNRQFRKVTAGLFVPELATSNLQYRFGALDTLAHQKNTLQHDSKEVIVVDYRGFGGLLLCARFHQPEPGVLEMAQDGGPGQHRGTEVVTGYLDDRALTLDQASEDLFMAQAIKHMMSMVIDGTAIVGVARLSEE